MQIGGDAPIVQLHDYPVEMLQSRSSGSVVAYSSDSVRTRSWFSAEFTEINGMDL